MNQPGNKPFELGHALAVLAGIAVFGLVFTYTGDSDLLFALGSGLGGTLLFYFLAWAAGARGRLDRR